jgi:hypothetical protein
MSTRNHPGSKRRPTRKADKLTAVCEAIVKKCGNLDGLTTLWASMALNVIGLGLPLFVFKPFIELLILHVHRGSHLSSRIFAPRYGISFCEENVVTPGREVRDVGQSTFAIIIIIFTQYIEVLCLLCEQHLICRDCIAKPQDYVSNISACFCIVLMMKVTWSVVTRWLFLYSDVWTPLLGFITSKITA